MSRLSRLPFHRGEGRSAETDPVPAKRASVEKASMREIRGLIGQRLKARYDLAEPLPDRLAELVKQLARCMDDRESGTAERE
jgi:tRNA A37 methylthiotransferase MiaB